MTDVPNYEAVLLDIEGTTTPVSFVYEVLYPYAQRKLKNFVEAHWNDPDVRTDAEALVASTAQSARDQNDGAPGPLPEESSARSSASNARPLTVTAIDRSTSSITIG